MSDLKKLATPKKTKTMQRFFKTGRGQYGKSDVFLGITVPDQRKVTKKYSKMSLKELQRPPAGVSSQSKSAIISLHVNTRKTYN